MSTSTLSSMERALEGGRVSVSLFSLLPNTLSNTRMATSDLSRLFPSLASTWQHALSSRTVITYASSLSLLPDTREDLTSIAWRIRCVPSLGDKAKAKAASNDAAKDTSAKKEAVDVFAPPYVADLLVQELGEFVVLLNKFAIVPRHFLLITRAFVPQKLPPPPPMLALVYRILHAHAAASGDADARSGKKDGSELMAFYNCGEMSGASQPHSHVQFVECELEGDKKEGEKGEGRIPVERLLGKCEDAGGKDGELHLVLLRCEMAQLTHPLLQTPSSLSRCHISTS